MAEKIVSPGVFTTEIDKSFLPAAIGDIGAAVIGPTVKGPALVPTVVESFAEFEAKFGTTFRSGSDTLQYLTSHFAENYLKHSGKLTIVRILDGTYSEASASIDTLGGGTDATIGSGSFVVATAASTLLNEEFTIGGVDFIYVSNNENFNNNSTEIYVNSGSSVNAAAANFVLAVNDNIAIHGLSISASAATDTVTFKTGSYSLASSSATVFTSTDAEMGGGSAASGTTAFELHTHGDGAIMNNKSALSQTNNILISGSGNNVRWEVSSVNDKKGTFNLMIRSGNDTNKRKNTIESWNNLSLDPGTKNYIGKMMGDSKLVLRSDSDGSYLQASGSFLNKSKYVWVSVKQTTVDYLDENGKVKGDGAISESLPRVGSGSIDGAFEGGSDGWAGFDSLGNFSGTNVNSDNYGWYDTIGTDYSQGYKVSDTTDTGKGYQAYTDALNLLSNQDEYDVNLIVIPGITYDNGTAIMTKAIDVCENRGDCFVIADPTNYGATITTATGNAGNYDSNYAAMYYPWIQVADTKTGMFKWVPPSTVMGGIYAFNDKVAHPWFAPAGLNRGGIETAIQAERKLTHAHRDTLYDASVNPIATFPGQGVTVWGQKTLQKKASALDRINVRRLLIKVKKFIASSSRFLVFEQNNSATRKRFLNIANPYLEQVQSNSGLHAFKVVMDESNNTPDVVDRNILYGQLFLQPTRTAEFIVLDFTIQPTGASFPE